MLIRRILAGAAAGYGATRVMDTVTTAFQERQSEQSRNREQEAQPEPAVAVLAKKVAARTGRQLSDEEAQAYGGRLHFGLGMSGGVLASLLRGGDRSSLRAGLMSAALMWVGFDEGANYLLGLSPPPTEFPPETHLRGLVGHVAFGLSLALLLPVTSRILRAG